VALHFSHRLHLLGLLRQRVATMLAFHRQHRTHFLDLFGGSQRAVMAGMALLPTRFALALLPTPARPRIPSQSIRRRRLRRVGGILLACRQLALQIGDLLFGLANLLFAFGDLLFAFGYLSLEIFNLSSESLVFALQVFPRGLMC